MHVALKRFGADNGVSVSPAQERSDPVKPLREHRLFPEKVVLFGGHKDRIRKGYYEQDNRILYDDTFQRAYDESQDSP